MVSDVSLEVSSQPLEGATYRRDEEDGEERQNDISAGLHFEGWAREFDGR